MTSSANQSQLTPRRGEPPQGDWVSLAEALGWIEYSLAAHVDQLLELAGSEEALVEALNRAWKSLSAQVQLRRIMLRGRRFHSAEEREISPDDVANCPYVTLSRETADRRIMLAIERHPNAFSSAFQRRVQMHRASTRDFSMESREYMLRDFHQVRVEAERLPSLWTHGFTDANTSKKSNSQISRATDYLARRLTDDACRNWTNKDWMANLNANGFNNMLPAHKSKALRTARERLGVKPKGGRPPGKRSQKT